MSFDIYIYLFILKYKFNNYDKFVSKNFLLRVATHPILSGDEHFMGFLQQKDGWRESIKETGKLYILS